MVRVLTLKLVCERKIRDLMPGPQPTERWEASGVLAKGRHQGAPRDCDEAQLLL